MDNTIESARFDALRQLNLLDTPPSESFDRITRMASQIFGLPISAISLTDTDRQWFKSRVGVEHMSIPRDRAPCSAVAEATQALLVPDLLDDATYADSILAQQGVRFYAGAPLTTREGYGLGALCVLGTEPRPATTPAEMAALSDLAGMVMAQIELQHAFGRIDPLSGLPNRTQLFEDLDDLGRDDPDRARLLVFVDLARAEQIDDGARVMGSGYVDDMVQEAARTLRSFLGGKRTAYHVATTQFAYIAGPGVEPDTLVAQIGTMLQRLRTRSTVRFVMNAAVGIAPFVSSRTEPRDVLRMAHNAALDARDRESPISIYSSAEDCAHRRRFTLLGDFGAALSRPDELRLMYQPRIDLASGRCVGAEALLRWTHPTLGDISPAEFIPIIEQTSLARPTTAKVLDIGLEQLGAWGAASLDIRLSINVSASNLDESDFAQQVELYLLKHRVPPAMLELELTETAIMDGSGCALDQMTTIDAAGITLAIDDFGTGHSSLSYLQRLPAKVVKIDQSFIADLLDSEREQTLVRSMIGLSHDLGYRVVAEGIETADVAALLTDMGCDEGQGYHFARPMEVQAFEAWLANTRGRRAAA